MALAPVPFSDCSRSRIICACSTSDAVVQAQELFDERVISAPIGLACAERAAAHGNERACQRRLLMSR